METIKTDGASIEFPWGNPCFTTHYLGVAGPTGAVANDPSRSYRTIATNQGGIALQGVLTQDNPIKLTEISDGASQTLLVGELSWNDANSYRAWQRGSFDSRDITSCRNVTHPLKAVPYNGQSDFNNISFGSMHAAGAHFAFADGSVRTLANDIALPTYRSLASRNGADPAAVPE